MRVLRQFIHSALAARFDDVSLVLSFPWDTYHLSGCLETILYDEAAVTEASCLTQSHPKTAYHVLYAFCSSKSEHQKGTFSWGSVRFVYLFTAASYMLMFALRLEQECELTTLPMLELFVSMLLAHLCFLTTLLDRGSCACYA